MNNLFFFLNILSHYILAALNNNVYIQEYNFYDYPCDLRIVNKIQSILEKIGENISQKSQICLEGDNKHLFNFNIWQDAKSLKLYLSNIDWQREEFHDVMVRFNDKRKKVSVAGGGTVCIELLKFDF